MGTQARFAAVASEAFAGGRTAADHLTLIGQLYELEGDKRRATSFKNGATAVSGRRGLTEGQALELPGVGKSIATVVGQFERTGTSDRYRELAKRWPADHLAELMRVKGIGPKKAMGFVEQGITSLDDLLAEVEDECIVGELANEIRRAAGVAEGRIDRKRVEPIVYAVREALRDVKSAKVEVCGSYRRGKPTVKDLDVVAAAPKSKHKALHQALAEIGTVNKRGTVRSAVTVESYGVSVRVDLWTVEPESFGAAKAHATGSKAHNVWRRTALRKIGIRENEYGLWRGKKRVGGAREEDAYEMLGVPYVKPENREEAP